MGASALATDLPISCFSFRTDRFLQIICLFHFIINHKGENYFLIKKVDKVLSITNLKFLEENTEDLLHVIGPDRDFLGVTSKIQATKENIYKRDYIHQR